MTTLKAEYSNLTWIHLYTPSLANQRPTWGHISFYLMTNHRILFFLDYVVSLVVLFQCLIELSRNRQRPWLLRLLCTAFLLWWACFYVLLGYQRLLRLDFVVWFSGSIYKYPYFVFHVAYKTDRLPSSSFRIGAGFDISYLGAESAAFRCIWNICCPGLSLLPGVSWSFFED